MEPLLIILVPGLLGGVFVAWFASRLRAAEDVPGRRLEAPKPGLINMARIRVNGIGGLGMVAMATTVALFVPRIRTTIIIALVLGIALAVLMIAQRRRRGPLDSTSHHPGAHSVLPID